MVQPDLRKILTINTETVERDSKVGEVISELTEYCRKMF